MGMNPSRIYQLSTEVANQIAAGEVIERPASVVKELLENAFDAQADAITIDIGFGGLNQVKVSDNGIGMVAEDLPLAIAAHATSKINKVQDLYAINSMGFRGEALASIAAISRMSLTTKTATEPHGMMLRQEGSDYRLTPAARTQGTTVEVLDLFHNIPVRKKFLKSPQSEFQAIELVVKRFALSAPAIAITLNHNEQLQWSLPAANSESLQWLRIKKLLGKAFTDTAIYLEIEQGDLFLQGWISSKDYQRSQNDKQWVYINQRMVKDKLLNHAIKKAYADIIYPGRYPSCVLYFNIKSDAVDVNVHPTKHEVRFQQPRLVHDFIVSSLSKALQTAENKSEILEPVERIHHPIQDHFPCVQEQARSHSSWHVLNAQFVLTFIKNTPYLVDVERLQQHRLAAIIAEHTLPLASRPLLVPVSYTVEHSMQELFLKSQPLFQTVGVEMDWIGDTTVAIRTIPVLFPQLKIKEVLDRLKAPLPTIPDLLKLLVACQSFDAHQLSSEEQTMLMDFLFQQLSKENQDSVCCLRLDAKRCREMLNA